MEQKLFSELNIGQEFYLGLGFGGLKEKFVKVQVRTHHGQNRGVGYKSTVSNVVYRQVVDMLVTVEV